MMLPIPAPGYQTISGKRRPPKSMGTELHCQLRNGHVDPYGLPWPVSTTCWIWERDEEGEVVERAGDVVAIRKVAA